MNSIACGRGGSSRYIRRDSRIVNSGDGCRRSPSFLPVVDRLSLQLLVLAIATLAPIGAQTSNVRINPNCSSDVLLTSNGGTSPILNYSFGCDTWALAYDLFGSSPAGSVSVTGAAAQSDGVNPNSFATFGTVQVGTNPSTSTVGLILISGYEPFVRVQVSGLSGTLRGKLYGWISNAAGFGSGSGGSGGGSAGQCTSSTVIALTASGNTRVIVGSPGVHAIICHVYFQGGSVSNFKLVSGHGSSCGTGTADIVGALGTALGMAADRDLNPYFAPTGEDVCINSSAAVTAGGIILWRLTP